jgi:hypothetical protein
VTAAVEDTVDDGPAGDMLRVWVRRVVTGLADGSRS